MHTKGITGFVRAARTFEIVAIMALFGLHTQAEDRSLTGVGNNLANPNRGAALNPLIRFGYPSEYPGNGNGTVMLSDAQRTNPRSISNAVATQSQSIANARNLSDYIWLWGQFVDHDMDLSTGSNGSTTNGTANIAVTAASDPLGPNSIPFTRSNFVMRPGPGGGPLVRQQINEVTAYIDASHVYGSDASRSVALRTGNGTGAKLLTSSGDLLPFNTMGLTNDNQSGLPADRLFAAGDVRSNENVGLTALHSVFVREHNRLVDRIEVTQPTLSSEQQFQLARKIVGAEMQVITYHEFLPALLGQTRAPRAENYLYNPQLPPDITQSFAHSAFRYGHSTVSPNLQLVTNTGLAEDDLPLRNAFFNPDVLANDPASLDLILKGAATQVSQEIDTHVIDDLRNFLFGPPGAGGLDLASLNIQRGRDHGLVDYNQLRVAYGLNPLNSFNQITSDTDLAQTLSSLYGGNLNNVDSWIAGLAETHLGGSSVGALFNNIIVQQFQRLRDGDRLFYLSNSAGLYTNGVLNPSIASIVDLNNIKLSDVLSLNTSLTNLQDNLFFASRFVVSGDYDANGILACADIDRLVAQIAANNGTATLDLTGDGLVNSDDLDAWLIEAGARQLASGSPLLYADANLDGVVDGSDFNVWNEHKFTSVASWCQGDFNADGVIDGSDFNVWNANKFTSADGAAVVPEPILGGFFVSALVAFCIRRSRSITVAVRSANSPPPPCRL